MICVQIQMPMYNKYMFSSLVCLIFLCRFALCVVLCYVNVDLYFSGPKWQLWIRWILLSPHSKKKATDEVVTAYKRSQKYKVKTWKSYTLTQKLINLRRRFAILSPAQPSQMVANFACLCHGHIFQCYGRVMKIKIYLIIFYIINVLAHTFFGCRNFLYDNLRRAAASDIKYESTFNRRNHFQL